ncbi:MAG: trypsin-like peptidase domain-containing protein [Pirellulaceae bacterium]|nr:trypsin-like peptidase domain-containing protein [Pirellulaceae bacterium]
MRRVIFLTFTLALSGVAGTTDAVDLIDDISFQQASKTALLDWLAQPDHVSATTLVGQLDSKLRDPISLPSDQEPRLLTPGEVYRARRDSVMALAYLYKCPRCDDWHSSIAGCVMLTADGVGVTNYHVIDQNKDESKAVFGIVTFHGCFYPIIEILAASRADDLAVFRVRGEGFTAAPLSAGDEPGEPVTAISHPSGNLYMVTTGIVARNYRERGPGPAAGRTRMAITAEFAKGSSGAGIFNARGELAGVVASTRSIYYSREGGIDRNLQMVLRIAIPAAAIRELLASRAEETQPIP